MPAKATNRIVADSWVDVERQLLADPGLPFFRHRGCPAYLPRQAAADPRADYQNNRSPTNCRLMARIIHTVGRR
ncbi:hypothetical protein J2801_006054 [Paraburkholderia phenoliruptrix]|nr:hypothetical protein [Paraburkholderia phenoliruptrix]